MPTVENVLLVVIDALRVDRVGVYNDTKLTPNIDALATQGGIFEECYSCINATDPSLTTILTGQYPTRHGLVNHGERITNKERQYIAGTQSLAERINNSHTTIAVDILGRWHQRGFTHYLQDWSSNRAERLQQAQVRELLAQIVHRLPDSLKQNIHSIYRQIAGERSLSQAEGDTITNTVLNIIDQSDEPWFALAHYWDTHLPYNSGNAYSKVIDERSYEDGDKPLTELLETIEGSSWAENLCDGLLGDAETVGDVKRQYDAAIYRTDQEVGRLVNYLKSTGELENTAIIVTADHGESMTEHDIFFDHHGLYDPSLHVPLIIRAPKFEGHETEFVQHFDLAPTILELLGKEYKKEWFDGISLVPTADDMRRIDRDAIYAEEAYTARRRCIRTDSYKYITRLDNKDTCRYCNIKHSSGDELYDVVSDPDETENIIDMYPEVTTQLAESLDLWINELPNPDEDEVNFEEDPGVMQRLEDMGYV